MIVLIHVLPSEASENPQPTYKLETPKNLTSETMKPPLNISMGSIKVNLFVNFFPTFQIFPTAFNNRFLTIINEI